MSLDDFFQKVIRVAFGLLFIIVPLILTPWNYELFEFNKMVAVYALTVIIVAAWIGRMILVKKIIFKRTFFDLPLLGFLFSQFFSFLFSVDHHTSFWGYYSRFHGGLLSTVCYLLLYWAFVSNEDNRSARLTLRCSILTALLVSLYGIAEHFGIDASIWVQDVRNRVFSTLGQPNWLAAYLTSLIPLTWSSIVQNKLCQPKSKLPVFFWYLAFLILTLCLLYTKSQSGILGFLASFAFFWPILFLLLTFGKKIRPEVKKLLRLALLIFILSFLILFSHVGLNAYPQIANLLAKVGIKPPSPPTTELQAAPTVAAPLLEIGGSASSEIRKIVWKGAFNIFKHYPIFGSGVETFAYSYYNFRPVEHNLVSEWDFLYNKAHNEYLNFLATTGIVGLGTYLFFIGSFVFWGLKKVFIQTTYSKIKNPSLKVKNEISKSFLPDLLPLGLLSGWLSILITNFFGFSVVPVALFFFLIPAFCIVLFDPAADFYSPATKPVKISSKSQKTGLGILLMAEAWSLISVAKLWQADYHYSRGDKLNKLKQYAPAFQSLIKAVNLNPGEPIYHNELGESAANLAVYFLNQKDATSASKLAQVAYEQSQKALLVSPRNLNLWKGRIKILYNLSLLENQFASLVLEAFQKAIELAPTDPKLLYNLGVIQNSYLLKNEASGAFQKAIELKPNYKDARYALALLLKEKGQTEPAREQLEYILKNIAPGDSSSAQLLKELNK